MSDLRWLRRMLGFGLLGVAAMTVLVPGILLARGTTGHDWYAAGKLTLMEAMFAVGFDEYATMEYRTTYGDTWNLIRLAFVERGPTVRARRRILATIGDSVMLGVGVSGTVFCLMLLGAVGHLRRSRAVATVERGPAAYPYRHPAAWGAAGSIPGWLRPGGGRARIGLVVVSAADIEDLPEIDGFVELAGFLPGADPAGKFVPRAGALAGEHAPAPLPAEVWSGRGAETAVPTARTRGGATGVAPAKTDTAGSRRRSVPPARSAASSGDRPGKTNAGDPNRGTATARGSGPGQDFY